MRLLLLGTAGCHLCEQAEQMIQTVLPQDYTLEIIDIAEQTQWQTQYAIRIPVLYSVETQQELAWKFCEADVQAFIQTVTGVKK